MGDADLKQAGNRRPHVCIIGAGISGLRAADVLLENDYEVTMMEARDRIGGRVGFFRRRAGCLYGMG